MSKSNRNCRRSSANTQQPNTQQPAADDDRTVELLTLG